MKLSVVTVSRQNLAGLRETLASLAQQDTAEFECWVVDGDSNDGTKEFLRAYAPRFSFHFVSEPDAGIYAAMNKGVERARGDYAWFLNAGDTCAGPRVIPSILQALAGTSDVDLLYGKVWVKSPYGLRSVGGPVSSRDFDTTMALCHQGIVYRRSELATRPYPADFKLISDWVVTRELARRGAKFSYLDQHLAVFPSDGVSSRQQWLLLREKLRYERDGWGRGKILVFAGGRAFALWLAKKTGLYHLYKKRQHATAAGHQVAR